MSDRNKEKEKYKSDAERLEKKFGWKKGDVIVEFPDKSKKKDKYKKK